VCNDGAVQLVVLALLARLVRRVRPMGVALAVYDAWRRLPPKQRERIIDAARRNAPKVASSIARRGKPRP
jgi:hypothetical protein